MKILALDTTSEAISVALQIDNKIFNFYQHAPRLHADLILPTINSLLLQANITLKDLNCLAVTIGPGSFTGVRLAVSVVKALAFTHDLPIIVVSSLQVLAQGAIEFFDVNNKIILSSLDARMCQIYFGIYKIVSGLAIAIDNDKVIDPDKIKITVDQQNEFICVGNGWQIYKDDLEKNFLNCNLRIGDILFPQAKNILPLALNAYKKNYFVTADQLKPIYLRDNVVNN